jgi:F-type H+-transporting ATPase subunit a
MLATFTTLGLTLGEGMNPLDHVVNHPFLWTADGWWLWSSHTGNLLITLFIMAYLFPRFAKRSSTGPEDEGYERYLPGNKSTAMLEVVCMYLQEQVARPVLGDNTKKYMPFLWTVFFFVLINNVLGMIPLLEIQTMILAAIGYFLPAGNFAETAVIEHRAFMGTTATGNIWITALLAIIAFVVFVGHGLKELGVKGFLEHATGGAPLFLWPIIVPIELAGYFIIKPGALAIRLFANMTAGHTMVATLLMFVTMGFQAIGTITAAGSVGMAVVVTLVLIPIFFLELFVALLQAFIFMFLTTIFIGQLSHHHDHEAEGAHAHA